MEREGTPGRRRTLFRSYACSRQVDSFGHEWSIAEARHELAMQDGVYRARRHVRLTLCEPMPSAERRTAQLAISDDPDRRLRAPIRRVQHEPTALLWCAAPQTESESDRRPFHNTVLGERSTGNELGRPVDEALLLDRDRGPICDCVLERVDVGGVCGDRTSQRRAESAGVASRR